MIMMVLGTMTALIIDFMVVVASGMAVGGGMAALAGHPHLMAGNGSVGIKCLTKTTL